MALMSAIVSQLAGAVLIGVFGGKWLDEVFHTAPFLLIVGLLLGLATGVFSTILTIKKFLGENQT